MARPDPDRPDPDRLLADVDESEQIARRARLKVFIGAAPGVGKTYAMLQEAHELRRAGVDVVVGVVETHGRPETAVLLEGLERIAPRTIDHRGVRLAEFDLDAALARRPGLLLLDELAHENAPGSKHAKRWQDVRDLLAAGIAVATTLNVQHVESLNDVVARITGVRVRETVPDSILDRADEIEVVDLPADDLLQRLREGKVYVPEQARHALANFFTKGNLIALRELALRRAAERLGRQAETWRRSEGAPASPLARERLLVLVDDPDTGPALVREGRRIADATHAEWWVVHVQTPGELRHGDERRRALVAVLGFAEDLGAESALLVGHEIAGEIDAFLRSRRIGRVLLGRGVARGIARLWRRSLVETIAGRAPGVQLIVSDVRGAGATTASREPAGPSPAPLRRVTARAWIAALAIPAATTALGFAMRPVFELSNIIMVYLLGVVGVAVAGGRGPGILAALVSVAAFDFCFVPPHLTFAVSDSQYLVTFAVMLLVAIVLSTLATRLQDQATLSRLREERAAGLYRLSRELAASATPAGVLAAGEAAVAELFGAPAVVWTGDSDGELDDHERGVARWVLDHGEPAGRGTGTLPAARHAFVPLRTARGVLGVLAVAADSDERATPERLRLLRACADQIALALERARLAGEAEAARLAAETETMRSTLLASVSHDLRTPLAVIQGTATTLRDRAAGVDRELLTSVVEEADHLNHLVGDLLDMTRLESGVELRKDWHPVEELVGAALARALPAGDSRPVQVRLEPALPLIEVDGVLVTQAFIHLLENARAHTPPGTPIEITAAVDGAQVAIAVADRGPGLAAGEEETVFEKFHRGRGAGVARVPDGSPGPPGSGLGLAICRAIVQAHGGSIVADAPPAGGARFTVRLPIGAPPPPAPPGSDEDTA